MTNAILSQLPTIPADAIQIENGQAFTTSLQIAKLFGKRHSHVLEKIQKLDCSLEFASANFSADVQNIDIGNSATRESKIYRITKNGFFFLVMGFNGRKAGAVREAYIAEFDRMADELNNRQMARLTEEQERQLRTIENKQRYELADSKNYIPEPMEIADDEREKYQIINGMMMTLTLKSDPVIIPKQDLVNALYPQMAQIQSWQQMAECSRIAEERIGLIMRTAHINPEPWLTIHKMNS